MTLEVRNPQAALVGGPSDLLESSLTHGLDTYLVRRLAISHRLRVLIDSDPVGVEYIRHHSLDCVVSGVALGNYAAKILAQPGLVAYWQMLEADGDLEDVFDSHLAVYYEAVTPVGYHTPGIIDVGVQFHVDGNPDSGFEIDRTPANPDADPDPIDRAPFELSTFSIEAWIKLSIGADYIMTILSFGMDNNVGWALHILGNGGDPAPQFQIELVLNDHYGNYVTAKLMALDIWYHAVAVLDDTAGRVKIYLDAVEVLNVASVETPIYDNGGGESQISDRGPKIGVSYVSRFLAMIGIIDDLSFFNVALTPAQILYHFSGGAPNLNSVAHEVDTYLRKLVDRHADHQLDTLIAGDYHHYIDTLLSATFVTEHGVDTLLVAELTKLHSLDSLVQGTFSPFHRVDTLISAAPRALSHVFTNRLQLTLSVSSSTQLTLTPSSNFDLNVRGVIMAVYQRGETIILRVEVRSGDTLTDPDTTPILSVTDPDGTLIVDADEMSSIDTGIWTYDLLTNSVPPEDPQQDPPLSVLGWYQVRFTIEDSSRITIEDDGFELKP